MKKYEVVVEVGKTLCYEVNADSYEEACAEAEDLAGKAICDMNSKDIDVLSSFASEIN